MGDLLKIAAPVAMAIPGGQWVGAALAGIDAVGEGKKAQKKADKYASQQERIAQQQAEWAEMVATPMLKSWLQENGFDAGTGKFSEKATSPYRNVRNPYEANRTALLTRDAEDRNVSFDQIAQELVYDYGRRGLTGDQSGLNADLRSLRERELAETIGFRRDLGVKSEEFESGRERDNIDASWNRVLTMLNAAQNPGLGAPLGTIGGLQGMYESKANNIAGNLAGLTNTLFAYGLGNKKRGPDAGDGTLSTNQSPTPIGGDPATSSPAFPDEVSPYSAVGLANPVLQAITSANRYYNEFGSPGKSRKRR